MAIAAPAIFQPKTKNQNWVQYYVQKIPQKLSHHGLPRLSLSADYIGIAVGNKDKWTAQAYNSQVNLSKLPGIRAGAHPSQYLIHK